MLKWLNFLTSATAVAAIAFAGLTISATAHASALVDPLFTVCQNSTLTTTCGNEPNSITAFGNLYAGVNGSGQLGSGPLNPFLLLVAVPTSSTGGIIGSVPAFLTGGSVLSGPLAGSSLTVASALSKQYGQTNSVSGGLLSGLFSSGDLYTFAGLSGNSSFNYANMAGGGANGTEENALLGYTPPSFAVYEFTVAIANGPTNLDPSNIYQIPYSSIPLGSYVAAWGIQCYSSPDTCPQGTHVYDSSFTVSSWQDGGSPPLPPASVPEPGTLALLGISLAALGFSRRRWKGRLGSARVA